MESIVPKDFLKSEVREGVMIDAQRKKLFKISIEILEEIKRICEKYNLRYFADSGTLLGAVRHKGFIPWDDDIDLRMPREDFEKFQEIAPKELPEYYFLQTPVTDPEYEYDIIKVRDSRTTCLEKWRVDAHLHHNMGVWVSIFPLDGRPANPHAAETILYLARLLREICRKPYVRSASWYVRLSFWIILMFFGKKRLQKRKNMLYRRFPFEESEFCTGMHSLAAYVWFKCPSCAYDESIEVPFEYTTIKIPKGYDMVLTSMYGNWLEPVKDAAYHELADFDPDTPYQEYVLKHYGYRP